jgi:hypothetical protein
MYEVGTPPSGTEETGEPVPRNGTAVGDSGALLDILSVSVYAWTDAGANTTDNVSDDPAGIVNDVRPATKRAVPVVTLDITRVAVPGFEIRMVSIFVVPAPTGPKSRDAGKEEISATVIEKTPLLLSRGTASRASLIRTPAPVAGVFGTVQEYMRSDAGMLWTIVCHGSPAAIRYWILTLLTLLATQVMS